MRICEASRNRAGNREGSAYLDIETIRRRVARIKGEWSPEMARARAIEGKRRREELENLLLNQICDVSDSEESCDLRRHGFSLVG